MSYAPRAQEARLLSPVQQLLALSALESMFRDKRSHRCEACAHSEQPPLSTTRKRPCQQQRPTRPRHIHKHNYIRQNIQINKKILIWWPWSPFLQHELSVQNLASCSHPHCPPEPAALWLRGLGRPGLGQVGQHLSPLAWKCGVPTDLPLLPLPCPSWNQTHWVQPTLQYFSINSYETMGTVTSPFWPCVLPSVKWSERYHSPRNVVIKQITRVRLLVVLGTQSGACCCYAVLQAAVT